MFKQILFDSDHNHFILKDNLDKDIHFFHMYIVNCNTNVDI
jgi:hypothetical protein